METRECKICLETKEINKFVRYLTQVRYTCKECRNKTLRTGKPNTGRYQKGHVPTHSPFVKGHIPVTKGKFYGNTRGTSRNLAWKASVKERDGFKCQKCGTEDRLDCHHIKPWKTYPDLRFEISNGITLCKVCHGKEEGPLNANNGLNTRFKKGHKLSQESIEKMKTTKRLRREKVIYDR
jgi:hypothetical protein